MNDLIIYLFLINALSFLLMLIDKQKAKKNKWRIPESTLLAVALLGGSMGTLFGMFILWHKIKKPTFFKGIPLILLLQAIGIAIFITKSDIR